jgi:uncharacterized membrane protein YdjX (TVP38/TMEM64 family)
MTTTNDTYDESTAQKRKIHQQNPNQSPQHNQYKDGGEMVDMMATPTPASSTPMKRSNMQQKRNTQDSVLALSDIDDKLNDKTFEDEESSSSSSVSEQQQNDTIVAEGTFNDDNDDDNNIIHNSVDRKRGRFGRKLERRNSIARMKKKRRMKCYIRIGLLLLLVTLVTLLIVDTATTGYVKHFLLQYLQWTEDNPTLGLFVYVVVYFVATVLFIPASIMMVGSGYIFSRAFGTVVGITVATISSFFGAIISAIVQFFIARFLLRQVVKNICSKYTLLQAFEKSIQQNGLRIFTLVRLSPIVNFNSINYIGGGSSVSFYSYCLALVALIPGILLGVIIGASIQDLASVSQATNQTLRIVLCVLGVTFSIVAICIVTIFTRKELNRAACEIQIEYNTDEFLSDADVVDALMEAMQDIQIHTLTGTSTYSTNNDSNGTSTNPILGDGTNHHHTVEVKNDCSSCHSRHLDTNDDETINESRNMI